MERRRGRIARGRRTAVRPCRPLPLRATALVALEGHVERSCAAPSAGPVRVAGGSGAGCVRWPPA